MPVLQLYFKIDLYATQIWTRGCSHIDAEEDIGCINTSLNDVKVTTCHCITDRCNTNIDIPDVTTDKTNPTTEDEPFDPNSATKMGETILVFIFFITIMF